MTDYFVDTASSGGDGTTQATSGAHAAFATIAAVNGATFAAGDNIYFKKGCTWREQLTVPSSGSAGNVITFGTYGIGAKPIIDGTNIFSGFTLSPPAGKLGTDANTMGLWDFNQSLSDTSANNRTLTDNGTLTYGNSTPLPFDYYGIFGSDYVYYPDNASGDANAFDMSSSNSYTVEAWVRISAGAMDASNSYVVVSKSNNDSWGAFNQWMFGFFSNGSVVVLRMNYTDASHQASYTGDDIKAKINDGGWHHIALVIDLASQIDHKVHMYVDGVETNAAGAPSLTNFGSEANSVNMTIGKNATGNLPFPGVIDQVRISNIARTSFPTVHGTVGTTYQKSGVTTQPKTAFYNGSGLTQKSGATISVGYYQWDWAANVLYINIGGDPSGGVVEAGQRDYCIVNGNGTAGYITINGIEAKGGNTSCILSSQNNNWIVQNSTAWGAGGYNILLRGNPSGVSSPATGIVVQNNTIGFISKDPLTGQGIGINIMGCTAPVVSGNTVNTANGCGIEITSGNAAASGAAAGTNALVYSNTLTNNEFNILSAYVSGSQIYKNYIHDSKGFGISNHQSINFQVYYNVIYNLTGPDSQTLMWNGIDNNTNSTGGTIYNNTVRTVCGNNITIETSSTGCTIKNNILDSRGNSLAPVVLWASPIYVDPSVSNLQVTLSNNDYIPSSTYSTGNIVGNWQTVDKILSAWKTATNDNTAISVDPLFVSTSTPDFHLQATSPCINAGTNVGLTTDYDGKTVPIGSAPDIGAYEWSSGGGMGLGLSLSGNFRRIL